MKLVRRGKILRTISYWNNGLQVGPLRGGARYIYSLAIWSPGILSLQLSPRVTQTGGKPLAVGIHISQFLPLPAHAELLPAVNCPQVSSEVPECVPHMLVALAVDLRR